MSSNIKNRLTLNRLLLTFLSALLAVLLAGNVLLNIVSTRDYLQDQLRSHAQDAATSLGLSLSSVIDARDRVAAERMIDAIFDSGNYRSVVMFDVKDKAIITRYRKNEIAAVPQWFIEMIPLSTPLAEAQVMAGWKQLGTLRVESHPGLAYEELWHTLKTQVLLFVLVFLAGVMLIQGFVGMVLLPLRRIEKQAQEISQNRFDYRAPSPGTRELASVAQAMNSMSDKLGKVFAEQIALIEDLRQQSYHDALTGLLNRDGFTQRLSVELESAHSVPNGSLMLLQLNHFAELNQQYGRDKADEVLRAIGEVLRKCCLEQRESFAARMSGAGFSAYFPGLGADRLDEFADRLMQRLLSLSLIKTLLQDNLVHVGLASAVEGDDSRGLLSRADMSLRQAQSRGRSGWQRYANIDEQSPLEEVRQASEWQAILKRVIATRSLQLHGQDIYSLSLEESPTPRPAFKQVLARIDVEGKLIPAGVFLPMAERFSLMPEMDQLAIELALQKMKLDVSLHLSLALSESTIAHEGFLDWLALQLARAGFSKGRLRFDVPEYALVYHEQAVAALCQCAKKFGFTVAVDRFGVSAVPYSYLQRLRLEAIRIDPSFIRAIDQRPENQFFLRMAAQMAHSQSVRVIGVGVETEAEWQTLRALGIDMAMGYVWGQPQALST